MKRKVIAIVVYPVLWLAFGLVAGAILSLTDWLSVQRSFVPFLLLGLIGLVFFVPAIITGWVARDRSAVMGALGVVFINLLIILFAPLMLPGFNIASPILMVIPLIFIGSVGGFIGGKLRTRRLGNTLSAEGSSSPQEVASSPTLRPTDLPERITVNNLSDSPPRPTDWPGRSLETQSSKPTDLPEL